MDVQVLQPREVPLGGVRAMNVRRTLPHRDRVMIGAWCFADHYGPSSTDRMEVAPHPHTGLQTVSWLFSGEIEHRDTGGAHALVRPGEMNLMTAGAGIAHSEVSTAATTVLHGVQLWVALPDGSRDVPRRFDRHVTTPVPLPGGTGELRVFLGEVPGLAASPVPTYSPLLGAELTLAPGARTTLPLDHDHEHGFLLDTGELSVAGRALDPGAMACLDPGIGAVELAAGPRGARVVLLGGAPFGEDIVMWWNFVGRSHEDVAVARDAWEAGAERFGEVVGYEGPHRRIPAPALPTTRLLPRRRRRPGTQLT